MLKRLLSLAIALCISLCVSVDAFATAAVTGGFAGISSYDLCSYGNRAGKQYAQNLSNGLAQLDSGGYIDYTLSYIYLDDEVTTSTATGSTAVTIFAYAGHGIVYDTSNNALHTNNQDIAPVSHVLAGEKTSTAFNKRTTTISLRHKYVVLYTCNQLTNGASTTKADNILKMMNGTRLVLGFASVMYLDSREATKFASELKSKTIADAFVAAAKYYQVQRSDGDSIARVAGYLTAQNDRITTTYSNAPKAADSMSSFGVITSYAVPHTGQTI